MNKGQGIYLALFSGLSTFLLMMLLNRWLVVSSRLATLLLAAASVVACCALFLIFRFYRDPNRKIPDEQDIVVSPADGRIIYIREISRGVIPNAIKGRSDIKLNELAKTDMLTDDVVLVGIMMTLMDVHVNRAPVAGRILLNKHVAGKFLSLKDSTAITENERNTMVFDSGASLVGMVQIASKQVRKIVTYVDQGDDVELGQRVGAILLGSQVDLILPKKNVSLLVDEGKQLVAGETIVARFTSAD